MRTSEDFVASALRRNKRLRETSEANANVTPTARFPREKSFSERDAEYRSRGYSLLHCVHGKHYFQPCHTCGRSEADGEANRERFVSKVAGK